MKIRSALFLTLSLAVHAVCITALALSHFKSLEAPEGGSVEVAVGEAKADSASDSDVANLQDDSANIPAPQVEPLEEKSAEKEEIKELPKKAAPKKVVKAKPAPKKEAAKIATVLPAKEKPNAIEEKTESMSPDIDDQDAVAIVEPSADDEKVELTPVKDQLSGVEAADANDQTEAAVEEYSDVDVSPSASAVEASNVQEPAVAAAGASKSKAVNYLNLKQYSGNKIPEYPLRARQERREGEVDLLYRVTKEGRVAEIQVEKSSGHADLDEAAVNAIAKYRFVPGQEGWARHPVIFSLKGEATTMHSKLRSNSASVD